MSETSAPQRTRAKALSADDRRAMIIEAVTPLIVEHGRSITTRQIADAAGIAEGTIFRAFPDKDALIEAVVERFLDPTALNDRLRALDPGLPLETKVVTILTELRTRMTGIFGIMSAVGMSGPPPRRHGPDIFRDLVGDILRPDLDALGFDSDRVASFIRLISFASVIPQFNQGHEIPIPDLARLITFGIVGVPASAAEPEARAAAIQEPAKKGQATNAA